MPLPAADDAQSSIDHILTYACTRTADVHKVSAKVKGEAPRFEKDAEKFGANAGAKIDSAVSFYAKATATAVASRRSRDSSSSSSSSSLVTLMEDRTTTSASATTATALPPILRSVHMHLSTSDSPLKNTWLIIS